MKAKKWNPKTQQYDIKVEITNRASFFDHNLEAIVCCANCEKELRVSDAIHSAEIHTLSRLYPFLICGSCYESEMERAKARSGLYKGQEDD